MGEADFLPRQREIFESAIAQPLLLALHLVVILLESKEVIEVFGLIDQLSSFLCTLFRRQPLIVNHVPDASLGSPSGCGTEPMNVASPARMVRKKFGKSK